MKNFISPMSNWLAARAAQLLRNRAALILAAALGVVPTPSCFAIHQDIKFLGVNGAFSNLATPAGYGWTNNLPGGVAYVEWSESDNSVFHSALTYEPILIGHFGDEFRTFGNLYFQNERDIAASVDINLGFSLLLHLSQKVGNEHITVSTEPFSLLFKLAFDPLDNTRSSVTIENPTRRIVVDGVNYEMNFGFISPQQASVPPDQWNTLIVPDGGRGVAEFTLQYKRLAAVPDAGSSFALLGSGLACLAFFRRLHHTKSSRQG